MLTEFPAAAQQAFTSALDKTVLDVTLVGFTVHPLQFRLGIGEIHVSRPAMHEQRDHRLGLRLEMRFLQIQVEVLRATGNVGRSSQQLVLVQESRQRHASHAQCVLGEKFTAGSNG